MIPTFLGSTVLVFTILQMAPGGPIEQMMLELQMGGAVAEKVALSHPLVLLVVYHCHLKL